MAEQAKEPEDREHWLGLERFWLRQAGSGKTAPGDDPPEFIKRLHVVSDPADSQFPAMGRACLAAFEAQLRGARLARLIFS